MKISGFVNLPKIWLDNTGIKAGDQIEFVLMRDGTLSLFRGAIPDEAGENAELILGTRTVMRQKGSKLIVIPKLWLDQNSMKAGDEVEFVLRNGVLTIRKAEPAVAQPYGSSAKKEAGCT